MTTHYLDHHGNPDCYTPLCTPQCEGCNERLNDGEYSRYLDRKQGTWCLCGECELRKCPECKDALADEAGGLCKGCVVAIADEVSEAMERNAA